MGGLLSAFAIVGAMCILTIIVETVEAAPTRIREWLELRRWEKANRAFFDPHV